MLLAVLTLVWIAGDFRGRHGCGPEPIVTPVTYLMKLMEAHAQISQRQTIYQVINKEILILRG
jgi:hypothetical protein